MPIYEYSCKDCERKVSVFFRTYADVDTKTPTCSHCGSDSLRRLMSRFSVQGAWGHSLNVPNLGMMDGVDEDNPHDMQEWMLRVKEQMGDPSPQLTESDMLDAGIPAHEPPSHTMDEVL